MPKRLDFCYLVIFRELQVSERWVPALLKSAVSICRHRIGCGERGGLTASTVGLSCALIPNASSRRLCT